METQVMYRKPTVASILSSAPEDKTGWCCYRKPFFPVAPGIPTSNKKEATPSATVD